MPQFFFAFQCVSLESFGPSADQGIIKQINIDTTADVANLNNLEEIDFTITPSTADEDDNYTVNVTIT